MSRLGNPPPGIQASGSHCAVRRRHGNSRTVLGGKGSLRRSTNRRALASCAPFCSRIIRDGRLRREPDAVPFLRLAKDENQVAVDKTSWENLHIEAVLNNDIIGSEVAGDGRAQPRVVRVFADPPEDSPARALLRYVKEVGERYVPGMTVNMIFRGDRFLRAGDHTSFTNQGFAAVRFTSASENYSQQHTVEDTFAHTSVPYATRVARMNAAVAASLALAPSAPNTTWTYRSGLDKGTRTPMLTRGASEYDAVLRWDKNDEPDLAGYAVVIRSTTSPVWEREIYVGNVTEYRIPDLSIDDIVIGVKALDRAGNQSLVSAYQPLQAVSSSAPAGQPSTAP